MKTNLYLILRVIALMGLLLVLPIGVMGQDKLHIAKLFEKYANTKNVTYIELNGSILHSYKMEAYRGLIFKDIRSYQNEIQQCILQDKQTDVKKAQEITESGILRSAFYQLVNVERKGKTLHRYILYKLGKGNAGTLIFIEGALSEKELIDMLYKQE